MSNFAKRWPTWVILGLGFGFLYLPILVLMFYSFNVLFGCICFEIFESIDNRQFFY